MKLQKIIAFIIKADTYFNFILVSVKKEKGMTNRLLIAKVDV